MGGRAKGPLSAQASLADWALSNLEKVLALEKPSTSRLLSAVAPVEILDWDTETFRELGTSRCNKALQALRNLDFPRSKYRALAAVFKKGIREIESQLPPNWALWTPIFRRYSTHTSLGWDALIRITGHLATLEITTPLELAAHSKTNIEKLATNSAPLEGLEVVWLAAKCFVEDNALCASYIPTDTKIMTDTLIRDLRVKTLDQSPIYLRWVRLKEALDLPDNFDRLKPAARATALATCGAPAHMTLEFLDIGARINILRSVQGSLRSVASGLNSYLRFCGAFEIPPFPVTTQSARRWSATFLPGKTFAQYNAHLRKACILLGHAADWYTDEIRTISRGLRNAQDRSFAFPNFLMSGEVLRIIQFEGRFAPMGMVAFLSYLFPYGFPLKPSFYR